MEIPTMGFPSEEGGGGLDPPPTPGRGIAATVGERWGTTLGRGGDQWPLSIQQGTGDHPLTLVDRKEPPSTWKDGKQDEGRGEDDQKG